MKGYSIRLQFVRFANCTILLFVFQAILSVIMLLLCSVVNITFLILRQRNVHAHHHGDIKVGQHGNEHINETDSDKERLLPDDSDETVRSRSSCRTKLLGDCRDGVGDRVYSSCSSCAENCDGKDQYDKGLLYLSRNCFGR